MIMNEDYASYELAKKLKECGFAEPCDHYYNIGFKNDTDMYYAVDNDYNDRGEHCCSAPLLFHAQKWLREEKGIHIDVCTYSDYSTDADGNVCDRWDFWGFELYAIVGGERIAIGDGECDSYEEALSEGIESALELIKKGE